MKKHSDNDNIAFEQQLYETFLALHEPYFYTRKEKDYPDFKIPSLNEIEKQFAEADIPEVHSSN